MRLLRLLAPLALLLGCQPHTPERATVAVHDDLGRRRLLPTHPRRMLALAPSITEMLYAVADTAAIIARTPADSFPATVCGKPVVNNHPLDLERMVLLRPDVVFAIEGIDLRCRRPAPVGTGCSGVFSALPHRGGRIPRPRRRGPLAGPPAASPAPRRLPAPLLLAGVVVGALAAALGSLLTCLTAGEGSLRGAGF